MLQKTKHKRTDSHCTQRHHSIPRWPSGSTRNLHPWQHVRMTWEALNNSKARQDTPPDILISLVQSDFIVLPSVFFKGSFGDSKIQGKLEATTLFNVWILSLNTGTHTHTHVYIMSGIPLYFLLLSLNNALWITAHVNKSVLQHFKRWHGVPLCDLTI